MNRSNSLYPLVLLISACVPGEDASSQAASDGQVWYYSFDRQRITRLHEEEIERYGCPFEIAREAFDRARSPSPSEAGSYDSRDVRAKVVFEAETIYIDRFGVARNLDGQEFLVDKAAFVEALVATESCD